MFDVSRYFGPSTTFITVLFIYLIFFRKFESKGGVLETLKEGISCATSLSVFKKIRTNEANKRL